MKRLLLSVLILVCITPLLRAQLVIDNFNTGAFTLSGPAGYRNNITAPGAIAGYRNAIVLGRNGVATFPSQMSLNTADGFLQIQEGDNNDYTYCSWGNTTFDPPVPTSLNLNVTAYSAVIVKVLEAPSKGVMEIILYKDNGALYDAFEYVQPLKGAGDYVFPLSAFTGVDLTDIDGIEMYFNNGVTPGSTIKVDNIQFASAPTPPIVLAAVMPNPITAGNAALLTAQVTPGSNPLSTGIVVTANLTSLGGANAQPLFDDGTNGDLVAGDNTFSFSYSVPVATTTGAYNIPLKVLDAQARSAETTVVLNVNGTIPPLVIDDFNTGPFSLTGPTGYDNRIAATGAIAGYRDAIVLAQNATSSLPTTMSLDPTDGFLQIKQGANNDYTYISWGNTTFDPPAPTNLNLNVTPYKSIVVKLLEAPSEGVLQIVLSTQRGSTYDAAIYSEPLNGPGLYILPLSKFIGANQTDIDGIELYFNNRVTPRSTLKVDYIQLEVTENITLPVRLMRFDATRKGDDVLLSWKVAEQRGVKRYEVERSTNTSLFEKVGQVSALSATSQTYQHTDKQPAPAVWFYRIKAVDEDGKLTYSNIVSVDMSKRSLSIKAYPNPVLDRLKLIIPSIPNGGIRGRLVNAKGQFIKQFVIASTVHELDMTAVAAGVYTIALDNGQTVRVVKQ